MGEQQEDFLEEKKEQVGRILDKLNEMRNSLPSLPIVYDIEGDDEDSGLMTNIAGESKPISDWTFHQAVLNNYIQRLLNGDDDYDQPSNRLDVH